MQPKNWLELQGDETLALDWDLNENSHVWEIGGFEGRWAQQIWDKFHCNITIFEPQLWAVKRMQKRFEGIDKIEIRPYGLWVEDTTLLIGNYHTDGASLINDDGREPLQEGNFKNYYHELFYELGNRYKIDVGLMNIEGSEYVLIPKLISSGCINHFRNFWCQFHPEIWGSDAGEIYQSICEGMDQTHEMIWNCYPTAVAWRKRE